MKKVVITADCVCDMPEELLEQYGIKAIYFYIITEHGCFRDREEVTSDNIVEYFRQGGTNVKTKAPLAEEYREFFEKNLKDADQIIHIAMSSALSLGCGRAEIAAKHFEGKVSVVDSRLFSTGMAHLVMKASELVKKGSDAKEIISALEEMKLKVVTGFIAENAKYLYETGNVNRFVKVVCEVFKIHPVLIMKKGVMKLKTIKIGNYENAVLRYVKGEMKKRDKIDKKRVFITHASCSVKLLSRVKREVAKYCVFEDTKITQASATITGNCGPNTIGVLFVRK